MIDANHDELPAEPPAQVGAAQVSDGQVSTAGTDPAAALDDLEADLAAVQGALESLDRIAASGSEGSSATEIDAVVSPERFSVGPDPQI